MIHSSPCVVDGVVGICDVALHLDLDFILCSVEVLENVCPVVQPNAVLCLERRPSISEHVRVHRDRACLWDSYPFLFVQEDLGIVQLVIVSVSNGVVRNNGIHIRSIPYEAYRGRMVMEVMTNSSSSAEWKISYLPSWGTAFQDPLLGTVTVCVEMEEFQNVNLMANILKPKRETLPSFITPHLSLTASDWSGQQKPSAEKTTRDLKSLKRWRIKSTPATKTTS